MAPTRTTTAIAISFFLVVCSLIGWAALAWAGSLEPLESLGAWVWRTTLYCFTTALVLCMPMGVVAILRNNWKLRSAQKRSKAPA